jgi:hypothetical protein
MVETRPTQAEVHRAGRMSKINIQLHTAKSGLCQRRARPARPPETLPCLQAQSPGKKNTTRVVAILPSMRLDYFEQAQEMFPSLRP